MGQFSDRTGLRNGRLVVLRATHERNGDGAVVWECQCDCGNLHKVASNRMAQIKSCGCLRTENHLKRITKHKSLNDGAAFCVYRQYKHSAERRGLEFSYPLDDFLKDISQSCYYCGEPPSNINTGSGRNQGKAFLKYSGLDRIDNSVGYVNGNVRPCCKACNVAKNDRTESEFMAWVKRIYNRSF